MRKIKFFALIMLLSASSVHAENYYDPQHTMLALNMAVVSVHRILAAKDRVILDAEYQNIINNLNLGNIRSDPEIMTLYEKLLDITSRRKLRNDESEYLRKNYNAQAKRSISSALSDLGKSSASVIRENGSIGAFFGSFSTLVSVSAASYFKYQTGGVNLTGSLDDNLYRLNAEDLADFNDMQKQLLSSSWNLLNKYHLPDTYRLTQKALDELYLALETKDASRRLRMLQALEDDFRVYPPYWFYRAKAAQEGKDYDEADRCYDNFDEVWRPVLRRDPYKLEAVKYRINTLLKDGLADDADTRSEILELAGTMRDNTLREDWENNLFAAALYYMLDERDAAIKCAEINIDFGYEEEITSAMLSQMKAGVSFTMLPDDTLRVLKLNSLTEGMTTQDREAAMILADFFDEREGYSEALSAVNNPLTIHARRIAAYITADGSAFEEILALSAISDDVDEAYSGAFEMVQDYADGGNLRAEIYLADMYNYGLGIEKDAQSAMKYYRLAGNNGDIYSQIMFVNLALMSRDHQAESPSQDELYSMGMKYYNAKDYTNAAESFAQSAESGHPSSQYMIGRMYEHGQGVSKNIDTAREWYTKAADNGDSRAKKALRRLSSNKSWWPF